LNVVDSSAWLAYFAGGPAARYFAAAVEDTAALIVPSICVYEVFKRILVQRGKPAALTAVAAMHKGALIELDASLALSAAEISVEHRLSMADSIIYASARSYGATLWTQDADFELLRNVRYRPAIVAR
jgi:toxin FitB